MSRKFSIPETLIYDCCNNNCLKFYNADGSIDYKKTSDLVTYCRESTANFDENSDNHSKVESFNWWMTKLESCHLRGVDVDQRAVFQYALGSKLSNQYKENVCRNAFVAAYGISDNQLAYKQELFKKHVRLGIGRKDIELPGKEPTLIDQSGRVSSKKGDSSQIARAAFERAGLGGVNDDMIRGALLPDSDVGIMCSEWLAEFFMCCGDCIPNSANEVHISECSKESIYAQYVKDKEENNEPYLSHSSFNRLWIRLFSNYKIRKWRQVGGKCNTCALLDSIRSETKNRELKRRVTDFVLLHRSMYMNERKAYYARRMLAHMFPDQYMSIITDGMAQVHSELPWQKNLVDAGKSGKLNQHLQGVLEHGKSVNIFRVFENLPLDTNHGIHSLLMVLEKRYRTNNNKLPDTIFIQTDGGKENTSRPFLAMCELLVAQGLTKKILVSRLPPGHTHEDIDAVFAQIWSVLQKNHAKSPQRYSELIKQALGVSSKRTEDVFVYDLFCIPDYIRYLTPYLDWKIADYAQGEKTQLQFCFEKTRKVSSAAINLPFLIGNSFSRQTSERFPLGVKVKYRRYSADKCVELQRDATVPGDIPLKAHIVHSTWACKEKSISFFKECPPDATSILPCPFRKDSHLKFARVVEYVKSKFEPHYYDSWIEFGKRFPKTDDSQAYVTDYLKGNLYVPFKAVLFNGVTLDSETVVPPTKPMKDRREKTEIIEGHKKANHCVRSRHLPNKVPATTVIEVPRRSRSSNNGTNPNALNSGDSSESCSDEGEIYEGGKCLPVHWGPPEDSGNESESLEMEDEEALLLALSSGISNKPTATRSKKNANRMNPVGDRSSVEKHKTLGKRKSKDKESTDRILKISKITERPSRASKRVALLNMQNISQSDAVPESSSTTTTLMTNEELLLFCEENYELLLGLRVNMWYPQYKEFFKGTVIDYNPSESHDKHWRVEFDVGGYTFVNLNTVLQSEFIERPDTNMSAIITDLDCTEKQHQEDESDYDDDDSGTESQEE